MRPATAGIPEGGNCLANMVPLDGSVLSESVIPLAISLTCPQPRTTSSYLFARPNSGETGLSEGQSHNRPESDEITTYLDKIAGQYPEISPTLIVGAGDAATEIERAADEQGADLVVIASRGRSGMVRGLLGSVTGRASADQAMSDLGDAPWS